MTGKINSKKEKSVRRWGSEDKVRICPNCGSLDLRAFLTIGPQELSRYVIKNAKYFEGVPSNIDCFLCKKCDRLGICPEIESNEVNAFRENLKRTKKYPEYPEKLKPTSFQKFFSLYILIFFLIGLIIMVLGDESLFFIPAILLTVGVAFFLIYIVFKIYRRVINEKP